jgi:elongation factor Ts
MFALRSPSRIPYSILRCGYVTETSSVKPSAKLVAEIRKRTETSIIKAREALIATSNDLEAALKWIDDDLAAAGAKRSLKLAGRHAGEGLVAVALLGKGVGDSNGNNCIRAAMVEVNCETDFVARSEIFDKMVRDIAWTVAFHAESSTTNTMSSGFIQEVNANVVTEAPLVVEEQNPAGRAGTIGSAMRDTTAKVGEKVTLRRATSIAVPAFPPSSTIGLGLAAYAHSSSAVNQGRTQTGRIASMVLTALNAKNLPPLLSPKLDFLASYSKLQRALARQVTGFDTKRIQNGEGERFRGPDDIPLFEQEFAMFASVNDLGPASEGISQVGETLEKWSAVRGMELAEGSSRGVEVLEFCKWAVGEGMEKPPTEQ